MIGTMGKGQSHYGLPLFLLPQDGEDGDLTPTVTTELLQQLQQDSPLVSKIQEVLDDLQDMRLTAEVNRTRRLLKNQSALKNQVQAIYKTAEPVERRLWDVNMQLSSARRRLQENQAFVRISDHWNRLHPPPLEEASSSHIDPIPPPHRLAMPRLHDKPGSPTPSSSKNTRVKRNKKNKDGKLCFHCQASDHLSFNFPRPQPYFCQCNTQGHCPNHCLSSLLVHNPV